MIQIHPGHPGFHSPVQRHALNRSNPASGKAESKRMKRNAFGLLFCSLSLGVLVACAPPPPVDPDAERPTTPPTTETTAEANTGAITEGDLTQAQKTPTDSLTAHQEGTLPATGALADVFFAFDRSELDPAAREVLQRNSDWIKQNPAVTVEIEGHADNRGTNEYNLALGARRAQAVKDYLVTLGNASDRLSTISYGEELPVCGGDTEECWEKNRRAHFVARAQKPSS